LFIIKTGGSMYLHDVNEQTPKQTHTSSNMTNFLKTKELLTNFHRSRKVTHKTK